MARWQEKPQAGQSVWSLERGNGIIRGIDWDNHLVYVDYYENGNTTHEYDDFFGCYNEQLKQWILAPI